MAKRLRMTRRRRQREKKIFAELVRNGRNAERERLKQNVERVSNSTRTA